MITQLIWTTCMGPDVCCLRKPDKLTHRLPSKQWVKPMISSFFNLTPIPSWWIMLPMKQCALVSGSVPIVDTCDKFHYLGRNWNPINGISSVNPAITSHTIDCWLSLQCKSGSCRNRVGLSFCLSFPSSVILSVHSETCLSTRSRNIFWNLFKFDRDQYLNVHIDGLVQHLVIFKVDFFSNVLNDHHQLWGSLHHHLSPPQKKQKKQQKTTAVWTASSISTPNPRT